MGTWDDIKNSPAGTEFTDKDGDRWQFSENEVVSLDGPFAPQSRGGVADRFFDRYGPYTIDETQPEPVKPEPTRVWSEHLADIARALRIIEQASTDLNASAPQGEPGHYSDLTFELPKRVSITLDGTPTKWALVYDEDIEGWMAEFGA